MVEEKPVIQKARPAATATRGGAQKFRDKREGRGKFIPRRRVCYFCVYKDKVIDYKDIALLKGFLSDRGKIEPRRRSGNCARHQRSVANAIKRARQIGLLPYTGEHIRKMGITGLGIRPAVIREVKEVREVPVTANNPPAA